MAVPGRRNGQYDDEDDDEQQNYALFEENGFVEVDADTPPHLRELSASVELGDVDALRIALGLFTSLRVVDFWLLIDSASLPCDANSFALLLSELLNIL